jgi:S1-C subfamily serine protease
MQEILRAIGVRVTDLATQERIRGLSGALVVAVSPEGLAAGRVLPGDLIFAVNESRVSDSTQFYLYASASAAVQATSLYLVRQGQELKVDLPVLPREEVVAPEVEPEAPKQ